MRHTIHILLLLMLAAMAPTIGQAQIIDDTTQMVYGAYTTKYYTFEDFKYNKYYLKSEDTTITRLHRYSMVDGTDYRYQNLGNLGTSLKSIFYNPPKQIGITSGYYTYKPYMFTTENIKYYDTKSPLTNINIDFGGSKRTKTKVTYARNITPFWNIGFGFRRITARKQVGAASADDRQTASTAYHFQSNYQAPEGKFRSLFNFARINHKVYESGGVKADTGAIDGGYFGRGAQPYLNEAYSRNFRFSSTLFNEYRLRDGLQFYHQFDYINDRHYYIDKSLRQNREYYYEILQNPPLINADSTTDRMDMREYVNEAGVKGDLFNAFYNFYVKMKALNNTMQYLPKEKYIETYGGFNIRYDIDSVQDIRGFGEYLMNGNYRFGGTFTSRWLEATYSRTRYAPGLIHNRYFGNHFEWQHDFGPTEADVLSGKAHIFYKIIRFEPELSVKNIRNNVYFDENAQVQQANGNVQLLTPTLDFGVRLKNGINFETEIIYTLKTGEEEAADAIRIPDLFVNANVFYSSYLFDSTIYFVGGIQANYKSSYRAKAYNPVLQQFYLQDEFDVAGNAVVDLYLNFTIDNLCLYLKYEYLNQRSNKGYFTHPYYVGQGANFGLGVRWLFFN